MPHKRKIKRESHNLSYFKKILRYNPKSGEFTWLVKMSCGTNVGQICGNKTDRGYVRILIDRKQYQAHRLAFLFSHNRWPKGSIDHINGEKSDNRIKNLREVTDFLNQQNRPCHRKGVLWGTTKIQKGKYYQARVQGKYLGNFKTMEEAHGKAINYANSNGLPLLGMGE